MAMTGRSVMLRTAASAGMAAIIIIAGAIGCAAQRPTETIRADGDRHFSRQEYAQAVTYYQEIAERTPGDWRAQHRLGLSLLEVDRPLEARAALEVANNLQPRNREIADALAEAMYQQGAYNELFAFLRQRADESRATREYLNLARYASMMGDQDTASVALLTAIEVDEGQSVEPYLSRAAFAAGVGNRTEVIRRLRQAYGVDPGDSRVLTRLAEYDQVVGPTLALPPGR